MLVQFKWFWSNVGILLLSTAALPLVPPGPPSSPSSQSGVPTADKGPSTEMEALAAAQQGMLHAVSLHTNAPHRVVGMPPHY